MKCLLCKDNAVISSPCYCKVHFIDYFEKKVRGTIRRFKLLKKGQRVAAAASGGKDSMSLLYLLHKLGYFPVALAVDEGISGYRDNTLIMLKKFCTKNNIELKVSSFKSNFNKSLDEILHKGNERPCTVCGVFRRYLLNSASKGYDVIATGHNMDDEAQAIVMNLVKGNIDILNRMGPISGSARLKGFTIRVKPFYLCSEKEIMVYSFLNRLTTDFAECPNVAKSFRLQIRDLLNEMEDKNPGVKRKIISWFLKYKKALKFTESMQSFCKSCGEPTKKEVCNACVFIKKIK